MTIESKKQSKAKQDWMKANSKIYGVRVMRRTESDIIDYLDGKEAATVFKLAIREYMAAHPDKPAQAPAPTPAPAQTPAPTEYRYGMRLRGYSPGAQPRGAIRREDDPSGRYHDIVIYGWKLNETEISNYELDPLD